MTPKGEAARQEILDEAMRIASVEGLEGLSLGPLAKRLGRSKSGLFAHFESKEQLQIEVLEQAADKMTTEVVLPAIAQPRGLPRVEALFDGWCRWASQSAALPGGCIFVSAATELDDHPGPVRDVLVKNQRLWLDTLRRSFEIAKEEGHLTSTTDAEQLAFETYSLMLGSYHYYKLLGDPRTLKRAKTGFARLVADHRTPV